MSDFNMAGVDNIGPAKLYRAGHPDLALPLEEGEMKPGDWALVIGDESTTGMLVTGPLHKLRTFIAALHDLVEDETVREFYRANPDIPAPGDTKI